MLKPEDFNVEKMLKMIEVDLLLKRMYNDLGADNRALQVVFNSEILGDSVMESIYTNIKSGKSYIKNNDLVGAEGLVNPTDTWKES